MDSGVHGDASKSPCSEMENDHRRSLVVAFYDLDESHFFQMFVAEAYHFPKRIGGLPKRQPMPMCMEGSSCENMV